MVISIKLYKGKTTITIRTQPELVAGEYWLQFEGDLEQVFKHTGRIVVTVR